MSGACMPDNRRCSPDSSPTPTPRSGVLSHVREARASWTTHSCSCSPTTVPAPKAARTGSVNEHRFTAHVPRVARRQPGHATTTGAASRTYNHYSWGWAWAGNTPFRSVETLHLARRNPDPADRALARTRASPGAVRTQFTHVIDLMPTILAAAGIDAA